MNMMTMARRFVLILQDALLPSPAAEPSLMGMPNSAKWTAEMVLALPDDGRRHEVVDGELLVTPAPSWRHQHMVGALHARLREWLSVHPVGTVILAPADIVLDQHTLVEPDLFVVPLVDGRKPANWQEAGRLMLVIEILSPSSARADRYLKRYRYQRAGVPEYWIVDLDARLIERWLPDDSRPELMADRIVWQPNTDEPSLEIEIPVLFGEIDG
jgi:Uma2 family endonuclease